jgi:hypothetical protein
MLERFAPRLGWVEAMRGNEEWRKLAEGLEQTLEWWLL